MGNSEKPFPFPLRLSPIINNNNTQSLFYLLLFLLVLGHSFQNVHSVASDGSSSRRKGVEWQILTKLNCSSEIRRHPNLLLMITLPCKLPHPPSSLPSPLYCYSTYARTHKNLIRPDDWKCEHFVLWKPERRSYLSKSKVTIVLFCSLVILTSG